MTQPYSSEPSPEFSMPKPLSSRPGGLDPLGSKGGVLGSLAASAHSKKLKTARNVLIVAGAIYALLYGLQFLSAERLANLAIEKEVGVGAQVSEEDRMMVVNGLRLVMGAFVAVGLILLALGFLVRRFPVPVTIMALVVFLSLHAVLALMNPLTLVDGLILKFFVLAALLGAMKSAFAFESDRRTVAAAEMMAETES